MENRNSEFKVSQDCNVTRYFQVIRRERKLTKTKIMILKQIDKIVEM